VSFLIDLLESWGKGVLCELGVLAMYVYDCCRWLRVMMVILRGFSLAAMMAQCMDYVVMR
jgi:hypothetical protein